MAGPVLQPVYHDALCELAAPARQPPRDVEQSRPAQQRGGYLFHLPDRRRVPGAVTAATLGASGGPASADCPGAAAAAGFSFSLPHSLRHAVGMAAGTGERVSHRSRPCRPVHHAGAAAGRGTGGAGAASHHHDRCHPRGVAVLRAAPLRNGGVAAPEGLDRHQCRAVRQFAPSAAANSAVVQRQYWFSSHPPSTAAGAELPAGGMPQRLRRPGPRHAVADAPAGAAGARLRAVGRGDGAVGAVFATCGSAPGDTHRRRQARRRDIVQSKSAASAARTGSGSTAMWL